MVKLQICLYFQPDPWGKEMILVVFLEQRKMGEGQGCGYQVFFLCG